jgi:FixJ family two-component response regulator
VETTLQSGQAIAIIDDSASVRRSLESLLRSLGFVVASFESAQAFLSSRNSVSCVVTDVEMPGMTGIDLYETMRADQDETPVIFITAASEQKVRQRLGAIPWVLSKPFEAAQLLHCVQQALSHGSSRDD